MSSLRDFVLVFIVAWALAPGVSLAQDRHREPRTGVTRRQAAPTTGAEATSAGATGAEATSAEATSAEATSAEATDANAGRPCAEGRVRTSGRCCWPEQTWSDEFGRCVGAPACPEALVEHGDACMLAELEDEGFDEADDEPEVTQRDHVPPPTSAPPRARGYPIFTPDGYGGTGPRWFGASTEAWPSRAGHPDAPRVRPSMGTGEDEGLITAALVVFDVGWILGWLGTWIDEAQGGGCEEFSSGFGSSRRVSCEGWGWSFVPIVGALASGLTTRSGTFHSSGWGIAFGISSIIVQGIGGIMAIIAFANETTEAVYQPLSGATGLSARLVPGAAGADAGLSLDVTF